MSLEGSHQKASPPITPLVTVEAAVERPSVGDDLLQAGIRPLAGEIQVAYSLPVCKEYPPEVSFLYVNLNRHQ